MGLWASSAFLWYIRIQVSDLSKGISTLMKNKQYFYTITEKKFSTTNQDTKTQNQKCWTYTDGDNTIKLTTYLYHAEMVSKEGNTTPLLISYEQQHGNMVSFLLPLESISQNSGLPGRRGKILVKKFSQVAFFSQHRVLVLIILSIRSQRLGRGERRQSCTFGYWCSHPIKKKSSKPQQGKTKRNTSEESPGIYDPKEYPSWLQNMVTPRCQQENFAPTKFEIKIWVWNFGRGVEDSKIQRNGFPLFKLTFILSRRSVKQTDVATLKKKTRLTLGSTYCFAYIPTHCFVAFITLTLGANFTESWITREDGGDLVKKFSKVVFSANMEF